MKFRTPAPQAASPAVPGFRDFARSWWTATQRLVELGDEESKLNDDVARMHATHALQTLAAVEQPPPPKLLTTRERRIKRAAEQLLDGAAELPPDPPPIAPGPREKVPANPVSAEMNALGEKIEANRAAQAAIRAELPKLLAQASRGYCDLVRPQYEAVAGRLHDAIVQLGNAIVEHDQFVRGLTAQGCNPTFLLLPRIDLIKGALGNPTDPQSAWHEILRWERDTGRSGDTPSAWTPARAPEKPPAKPRPDPNRHSIRVLHRGVRLPLEQAAKRWPAVFGQRWRELSGEPDDAPIG